MHGNVWEGCAGTYSMLRTISSRPRGIPVNGPRAPAQAVQRLVRGVVAVVQRLPRGCRVGVPRLEHAGRHGYNNLGFRVARVQSSR